MFKQLLIGLFLLISSPTLAQQAFPVSDADLHANVVRMDCHHVGTDTAYLGNGTVFILVNGSAVTAAHVWNAGSCRAPNTWFKRISSITNLDFAQLQITRGKIPNGLEYSCEALHKGETYIGVGFPTEQKIVLVHVHFTGVVINQAAHGNIMPKMAMGDMVMAGHEQFAQGESGGPVFNSQGKVVAFISGLDPAGKLSFARALIDTPLCSIQHVALK